MGKFVLDCGIVSEKAETFQSLSNDLSSVASDVGAYDTSGAEDFNFATPLRAIVSNLNDSVEKMSNSSKLCSNVIDTHTNLHNSLKFTTDIQVVNSSPEKEIPANDTEPASPVNPVNPTTVTEPVKPASPANPTTDTEASDSTGTYTVQSGDSLSKIAAKYGVSLASIIAANPQIENKNLIYPGDIVNIPKNTEENIEVLETKTTVQDEEVVVASNQNKDNNDSTTIATEVSPTTPATASGKEVKAKFTAYYPANNAMEGGFYDCKGNLLDPSKNTCAAPKEIPYGTKIQIQGTGTELDGQIFTVTDRGGAINIEEDGTYHFDILMSTGSECNSWGVKGGEAIILS